jgi:hypothetical protein
MSCHRQRLSDIDSTHGAGKFGQPGAAALIGRIVGATNVSIAGEAARLDRWEQAY